MKPPLKSDEIVDPDKRWPLEHIDDIISGLTDQQLLILRAITSGETNGRIASLLCRSEKSIEKYVDELFDALGLRNRVDAAVFYTVWSVENSKSMVSATR